MSAQAVYEFLAGENTAGGDAQGGAAPAPTAIPAVSDRDSDAASGDLSSRMQVRAPGWCGMVGDL